ncbi:MAG: AAA family ATPase [Thermomicrobiales bacterium]
MEKNTRTPSELLEQALREHEANWRAAGPPPSPGTPTTTAGTMKPVALVRTMAEVTATEVDWLWPNWLARGKFHLLGGFAGDGKSTLTAALAATASRGAPWPDGAPGACTQRTLFVLGEDAAGDTLKPRLAQHGADMNHVLILDVIQNERGQTQAFDVSRHLAELETALTAHAIDLLVIDPLTTIMPGADRNSEGAIRDLLTPLIKLAEERGVAMVGVVHVGKSGEARRAAQKILGATAFVAIARLVMMIAPDGEDTMGLGVVKSNLALKPPTLAWGRDEAGAIRWLGEVATSIEALLQNGGASSEGAAGKGPSAAVAAEVFLCEQLHEGERPVRDVQAAARQAGIAEATLRRAKETLGVQRRKSREANGGWMWWLPPVAGKMLKPPPSKTMSALSTLSTFDVQTGGKPADSAVAEPLPGFSAYQPGHWTDWEEGEENGADRWTA